MDKQLKADKDYWVAEKNMEWYNRQFREPYRITVAFHDFLEKYVDFHKGGGEILDIGCGSGAALWYIANRHPDIAFTGLDINDELFSYYQGSTENVQLKKADCYHLEEFSSGSYRGIISQRTLSWLPDYQESLNQICRLNPEWISFSSLLYEGRINYRISLENYERPTKNSAYSQVYYNVYSVPLIREFLADRGYHFFAYSPFEIDMDIKRPEHFDLGYYTVKTEEGRRLSFNTCMYQPEGFIFASRKPIGTD